MTRDEAANQWCPFVRLDLFISPSNQPNYVVDNRGNNVDGNGAVNVNCIADRCMCWRWHTIGDQGQSIAVDHATSGYCGLGGPAQR